MKKKLIIIFSSIAGAALIILAIFVACSDMEAPVDVDQESESATVTLPINLSPFESNAENDSTPTETEAKAESMEETHTDTNTLESTLDTEAESEQETMPAPHVPSLQFSSHGDGTCSVVGIGDIKDSYLAIPLRSPEGDVVTSISEKAFFGNNFIRAIELPSTVSYIGEMAFSNCSELVYISVDKDNKVFTDVGGILFSSDMTKIISLELKDATT